jgi:hypothetical protein
LCVAVAVADVVVAEHGVERFEDGAVHRGGVTIRVDVVAEEDQGVVVEGAFDLVHGVGGALFDVVAGADVTGDREPLRR